LTPTALGVRVERDGRTESATKWRILMSDMVCIHNYGSRIEAELAQSILDEAGIRAMVSCDDCGGIGPHLAFTSGGIELLVMPHDAESAAALLETRHTVPPKVKPAFENWWAPWLWNVRQWAIFVFVWLVVHIAFLHLIPLVLPE
jgi:hypothetical protein